MIFIVFLKHFSALIGIIRGNPSSYTKIFNYWRMSILDVSVFITQKIILAYSRRIDRSRFEVGKIAREPIPRKLKNSDRGAGLKTVTVHTSLTASENQALEDVIKYHNFIDKYGRPEYSQFLACVIIKMWGDRDEAEEVPVNSTPRKTTGLDALNPNNF